MFIATSYDRKWDIADKNDVRKTKIDFIRKKLWLVSIIFLKAFNMQRERKKAKKNMRGKIFNYNVSYKKINNIKTVNVRKITVFNFIKMN